MYILRTSLLHTQFNFVYKHNYYLENNTVRKLINT